MKKKGFTLIEIVVVLAILAVLMPIGLKAYKYANDISVNLKKKSVLGEISELLSYAKYYCRSNDTAGRISITGNKEMTFRDDQNMSFYRKLILPEGLTFTTNYIVTCTSEGVLSANSIYIRSGNGHYYRISIAVGVDKVNFYEDE